MGAVTVVAALHLAALLAWAPPLARRNTPPDVPPQPALLTVSLAPLVPARLTPPPPKKTPPAQTEHPSPSPPKLTETPPIPETQPRATQPLATQTASGAADPGAPSPYASSGAVKETASGPVNPVAFSPPTVADADPPLTSADYLDSPPPAYPAASRRRGEQGRVMVSVLVSAEGLVKDAFVATSSGFPRLDEAALVAVRRWKFVPARRGGVAIDRRHLIPMNFVSLPA
jgi:protein TonB